MVCEDCGDQGAECLTHDRVRVCVSCLYERTARERDALREEVARCHDSLREADRAIRQAYAERDEALLLLATERGLGGRCQCGDDDVCLLARQRDEARAEVEACHLYGLVTDEHAALADALGLRDGKHTGASIARHARAEIEQLRAALGAK